MSFCHWLATRVALKKIFNQISDPINFLKQNQKIAFERTQEGLFKARLVLCVFYLVRRLRKIRFDVNLTQKQFRSIASFSWFNQENFRLFQKLGVFTKTWQKFWPSLGQAAFILSDT